MAEWRRLLLEDLADAEGGLLDRIVGHVALGGQEQTFLAARLAHRRGNTEVARDYDNHAHPESLRPYSGTGLPLKSRY